MGENSEYPRRNFLAGGTLESTHFSSRRTELKRPLDRQASHFERYSKNAMACEFELLLNLHQYEQAAASALASFAILDSIEDQMSIYREASELSVVNRIAAKRPYSVDERLFAILQLAQEISAATHGAFDITAGPLSRLWGFHKRQGSVPDRAAIDAALANVGMQHLQLDPATKRVRFAIDELKLDLGGIGKGFAIDLAAESLAAAGIRDFVLPGGQSSVAACGSNFSGESTEASGWCIGLSHPTVPNCRLAEFQLVDQKLGTSGTQRQGFFFEGRRLGHIIDPRTGWPTDHCLSATVICDRAAVADALATAFFVMEVEEVQTFCDRHSNVATILVYPDARSGVRLETFNCDAIRWQLLR